MKRVKQKLEDLKEVDSVLGDHGEYLLLNTNLA